MTALLDRILTCFEEEIIPATRASVAKGNKVFGAAILRKNTLETVIVGTNNEIENPLWHGEVHTLKLFHELPDPPDPKDLIFISTHEPCSMCLSAITWAGFDNFTYFFTYEDSRDAFAIPHDLKILDEVFRLPDGDYRRENAFWTARSVASLLEGLSEGERDKAAARIATIRREYDELSALYQSSKLANVIPLN
jgi:tRNA(Arg) A34 adenosine deaminase TadA